MYTGGCRAVEKRLFAGIRAIVLTANGDNHKIMAKRRFIYKTKKRRFSGMSVLEHFVAIAPYFHQLVLEDCHFTITDKEKFIVSIPGKTFKMGIKVGDPIKPGATLIAMQEKRRIVREGNKQLFGIAHIVVSVPIIENDEAVGCISIAYSRDKNDEMYQMAQTLEEMTRQIAAGARTIAEASGELSVASEKITDMSSVMGEKTKGITEVINFATDVASRTNLLGVNAAIQAAHAGEYGKGFSVVAQEIRRLAKHSDESAKNIQAQIKDLQAIVEELMKDIEKSHAYIQEQAAGSEEIAASIEEINKLAKKLSDLAFRELR
jgi:hypothetical protein